MKLAFTFPGQGSQSVGMLAALAESAPQVRETFDAASGVLGFDLWELAQHGPEERLNATRQTQPAMLAAGVAVWRAWQARGGPAPAIVAGHSLGEFSALVCAGAMDFEDAVRAVAARARFMQEAVPEGEGGIAAVLGVDDDTLVALCETVVAQMPGRHVSAVNFNAPGQVVVAGHADAVERALAAAREAGARRAIPLPMSVPVHCALMAPAAARFAEVLEDVPLRAPAIPVVHNADLASHDEPAAIRRALVLQLTCPVRWVANVEALDAGCLVEPGPGRVLSGLARRINRDVDSLAVHDPDSLEQALERVRERA